MLNQPFEIILSIYIQDQISVFNSHSPRHAVTPSHEEMKKKKKKKKMKYFDKYNHLYPIYIVQTDNKQHEWIDFTIGITHTNNTAVMKTVIPIAVQ